MGQGEYELNEGWEKGLFVLLCAEPVLSHAIKRLCPQTPEMGEKMLGALLRNVRPARQSTVGNAA